jgi:hypothetical protein
MRIRKYNFITVPFLSFFSKRAYRDVGRNWKGINFAYLFLLLAICCIPPTLTLRDDMIQSLSQSQADIINQIPDIEIKNGQVIVEQTEPLFIERQDGSPVVIIDTTGSMNYIDDVRVVALLTETELIVRRGEKAFNTFDLSKVTSLHINKFIANEWLTMAKSSIAPLSYGLFLMVSYTFAVLVMIFAAIIGLILSLALHGKLSFAGALRVAAVAATPSIIFITVSAAVGISISPIIYLAITLVYLAVGINACTKGSAESEDKVDLKAFLSDDIGANQEAA